MPLAFDALPRVGGRLIRFWDILKICSESVQRIANFPLRRLNVHLMKSSQSTTHLPLKNRVDKMIALCTPDSVEWCDGSQADWDRLSTMLVEKAH